jgi:preprotein translocase subunit Sss1
MMRIIGIVLIVLGLFGFLLETITLTTTEEVVDLGPIEVERQEERTVPVRPVASAIAIAGGVGFLYFGSRRSRKQ